MPKRLATKLLYLLFKVLPRKQFDDTSRSGPLTTSGTDVTCDPGSIWVVVPAYNEARVVTAVVASLRSAGYSVVVVDDGSSDDTSDLARSAGAIVLRHCQNLGQGGALWTGITFCVQLGAQLICTFDADGQHRVEDIERMWRCMITQNVDVVLGSRFLGSSPGISFSRKLLLRLAVLVTRLRSGLPVTDTHNGLRLMRWEAACRLNLRQLGMAHASEIIERIAELDLRWSEAPVIVRYTEYSVGKGQPSVNSIKILFDLLVDRIAR